MKKLLAILVLGLLLSSCSDKEAEKEKAKRKSENHKIYSKYMNPDLIKKLTSLQSKELEGSLEKPASDIVLLSMMYADLGGHVLFCEIMKEALERPQANDEEIKIVDDPMENMKKECGIYKEIFEKYSSMYTTAAETQTVPSFYFFKSKAIESEQNDFDNVGMFPTLEECEHYFNIFLEKEIALVGKCKKYRG